MKIGQDGEALQNVAGERRDERAVEINIGQDGEALQDIALGSDVIWVLKWTRLISSERFEDCSGW